LSIAKTLAAYLKDKPYDIILAGRQAMDDDAGIVGPAVAELLGIPHANTIIGLEVDDPKKEVKVLREVEGGKEILSCSLPALFTCQKGLNNPRIPQVMNVMKAMKAQIKKVDLAALGLNAAEVGGQATKIKIQKYLPPPKRPPIKMIKEDFRKCEDTGETSQRRSQSHLNFRMRIWIMEFLRILNLGIALSRDEEMWR
jgi:electron transfer flavoprotein beta subunit